MQQDNKPLLPPTGQDCFGQHPRPTSRYKLYARGGANASFFYFCLLIRVCLILLYTLIFGFRKCCNIWIWKKSARLNAWLTVRRQIVVNFKIHPVKIYLELKNLFWWHHVFTHRLNDLISAVTYDLRLKRVLKIDAQTLKTDLFSFTLLIRLTFPDKNVRHRCFDGFAEFRFCLFMCG